MSLFNDLSKFGLKNLDNIDIMEDKKPSTDTKATPASKLTIDDLLYLKKHSCPVCHEQILHPALRSGKNRLLSTDDDLKVTYSIADPILYDVIHCECGYTAMSKTFPNLLSSQVKLIKESICKTFKSLNSPQVRSIEDGIDLYKLALVNTVVKKGKNMEKGLICLRIAWLYRDLHDIDNEKIYLENAYKCFKHSLDTETLPVLDMDFNKTTYLVAILGYKCGYYDVSQRMVSALLLDKRTNGRIRNRALDLKEKLKPFVGKK
ncbi:MAG: hypothetical protein ATN35_03770 [Epulopiscium sp. Nele67-Bin004]|nr:MAG: hypothetical protein ATN35_03770 [Epulopiscium sp. Nele67-Bin004]